MKKVFAISIMSLILLTACGDSIGDRYVSFAQCLDSSGTVFYGAYWCPHCASQKALFGKEGAKYLPYVECDFRGVDAQPALCEEKGVDSYPTWIFRDGSVLTGEVSLATLAQKTECTLPVIETAEVAETGETPETGTPEEAPAE
ncbi:MAG: hypothetical protein AAB592_01300 [Patescibacteria group bacterium]